MCGLFGAIGENFNVGIIRALALINRERGTDSIGFFNNTGKMVKRADDPLDCIARNEFNGFVEKSARSGWFVCGHTRYATTGAVSDGNAHPFRFGHIIGSHNGCVSHPKERSYRVDSEYLFDQLQRAGGDYQTALADISGYWGLTWFDGAALYLQAHENTIAIARADDGVWYYSSDRAHLAACIGTNADITILQGGATWRFNLNSPEPTILAPFVSSASHVGRWNRAATGTRKVGGASWRNSDFWSESRTKAPATGGDLSPADKALIDLANERLKSGDRIQTDSAGRAYGIRTLAPDDIKAPAATSSAPGGKRAKSKGAKRSRIATGAEALAKALRAGDLQAEESVETAYANNLARSLGYDGWEEYAERMEMHSRAEAVEWMEYDARIETRGYRDSFGSDDDTIDVDWR